MYANTNMARTLSVCQIYIVNLGCARSDLIAYWLVRWTLEQADQGRFLDGHLLDIIFSSSLFNFIIMNYFLQVK